MLRFLCFFNGRLSTLSMIVWMCRWRKSERFLHLSVSLSGFLGWARMASPGRGLSCDGGTAEAEVGMGSVE